MPDTHDHDAWAKHEAEQRRAWRTLTPLQRLLWLEDMKRFVAMALGAARRVRKPPTAI